jgi:hypothetical protein
MPAWEKSMQDVDIWNVVALTQKLPELDAAAYQALVAKSAGHSHSGMLNEHHEEAGADAHSEEGSPAHPEAGADVHPEGGHHHAPGTPAHTDEPTKHDMMAPHNGGHASEETHGK